MVAMGTTTVFGSYNREQQNYYAPINRGSSNRRNLVNDYGSGYGFWWFKWLI